jgi:predicted negative regulator of RcsB-dependent stress response
VGFLKGFSLDTPYSNVIQLFQSGVFGEELRRRMEAHLRDKGAARLASLEEEEELDRKKLKQAKRSLDANDLRGAEKCLKEIVGERRWSPATKAGQEAWDLLPKVREMAEAQEEKARSDAQKSEREAYRKARVPAVRKSLLSLAKKFLDANDLAVAKRRLNEIIKEYPDTDEAKEAAKLLRELEGESQERE